MGIPIKLYTSNKLQYINSNNDNNNIPQMTTINDNIRQRIYDKMLCSTSNQTYMNHNIDLNNIQMNCKIELFNSLKISNRSANLKFQTCNNNATIIFDMSWIQPISVIYQNNVKNIDLINDIKNLFDLKNMIINVDCYAPKHSTQLIISIFLQNNTIIIMNYDLYTGNIIKEDCFSFSIPCSIAQTHIIKLFLEFLPFYLIIITNQQLLIYDTLKHTLLSLDNLPKKLINKRYEYFINFPQLLITNNKTRIWKIDNFLEMSQLEIKKFNLKPILRDDEFISKMLITDLSYFTMETNQRIITINTIITDYVDFKILLIKNCMNTITLYSSDMKQIILIEKNLYSLSLSILNWSNQCNKYILTSYNDLQNNLLSSNNESINSRHIQHALFDPCHNIITLFHSNDIIADTFTINYDRCNN